MTSEKLKYVKRQIVDGNFSILNHKISTGIVYKVHVTGDLKIDGYEHSFLYITTGSSIKEHIHINDIELYRLISGVLSVNGDIVDEDYCLLDDKHGIDRVEEDTIVETIKLSSNYLKERGIFTDCWYQMNELDKLYQKSDLPK